MRFLIRHPLVIAFILGIGSLSYLVYGKIEQPLPGPGGGFGGGAGRSMETVVRVEPVRRQLIADQVESIGTTVANESVNLTAKVSETVSKVLFEDGAYVEEGDILVELTNSAEATRLAEAQAGVTDTKRQYERLQDLVARNLVASVDLDQAGTALEQAQARLDGILVSMDDRLIRAPFSGILGFRNVSEGSLLSPGTVISTLDDISIIKLDFTVPEIYLADVQPGQTVHAKSIVYKDHEFEGLIRVVGSRIDPVTRSVSVRAHIDNPDGTLRPGMLLTVALALNEHESTVVPEMAVVANQGQQHVFVVDEENYAHQVEVELGRRRPGLVEILSGVVPGQRVVTEGIAQVRPDQKVRVLNPGGVPTIPDVDRERS
ncbi:MAG: efflux RND transporter periplasmic adaptor subunit [Pseudohongiellaceae bacterium]